MQTFTATWLASVYLFTQTVGVGAVDGQHHSLTRAVMLPLLPNAAALPDETMANNLEGYFSINTANPLV